VFCVRHTHVLPRTSVLRRNLCAKASSWIRVVDLAGFSSFRRHLLVLESSHVHWTRSRGCNQPNSRPIQARTRTYSDVRRHSLFFNLALRTTLIIIIIIVLIIICFRTVIWLLYFIRYLLYNNTYYYSYECMYAFL
jgi:hypothetical protein